MPSYKYLIVGGGMTASAAVSGIREVDSSGTIGIIGNEPQPPYDRPPLSKGLWKDKTVDSIWRKTDGSVKFHLGRTATQLDAAAKQVTDDQGTIYSYQKLLLTTGCKPRLLPFGGEQIIYFRNIADYHRLRSQAENGERFAVIGSGFMGSEMAAALTMINKKVVLIFPDEAIGSKIYPPELANFLNAYYREKGVELVTGANVIGCESRQGKSIVKVRDKKTNAEKEFEVDGVVAGIGVVPDVELAKTAGLTIDNGIVVDTSARTSDPSIYAAGDVANYYNPALNQRLRVEHEDNANAMGAFAGAAMAGRTGSYDHLPFFYSDMFEMGYEAVGELDSRLENVTDWKTPNKEGVVYYLRGGRVRGVLLWNIFGQVDGAQS